MSKRVIGLTGGIATGKSTVGAWLSRLGIPVIDADRLAREAVAPGSPILAQIVQRYGPQVQDDGTLNRSALAGIIFNDPQERAWVEARIHPWVREALVRARDCYSGDPVCLMIPLLFEAHMNDLVTETWVVTCTPEQQLARLRTRDGLDVVQAQARIASQMPLELKARLATVVLENSGDLAALEAQVHRALVSR
ncbi:MAG: dephospho-CoA kinase [Gemmatimonadaceae bacterium]|nr:dephospho-CoA kinase [Gloeobacterales cyanobacterium ES-bin-141]